ncbi:MAG: peptide chain release factor N(5)-glutamine methyltransferase [Pyrinomonadaceae bacterium]
MQTITEFLTEASQILEASDIADPRREASSLLLAAIEKDKTFLFAHPEYELTAAEQKLFRSFVLRRASREPFHYIVGHKEFYGLDFEVTPEVLIPRPETEMLVRQSIKILREIENPIFCEIGAGSGCISVSILCSIEKASATGLEISEKAIAIANRNSIKHNVSERLTLKQSDIFSALTGEKFDLIVSNPPYVPASDVPELQPEVRDFEPHLALTGGGEGLSIIERIIIEAPRFLKREGFLLIEIGLGQAETVSGLFDMKIWRAVDIVPDFQTIPRMVRARIN